MGSGTQSNARDPERSLVFVGGTGRSGTHIVGRLLGEHAAFADVPIEARFHCNKRGLPDLLEGRVSFSGFVEKLRDFWWHRVRVDDQPRGLYSLMYRLAFDEAVSASKPPTTRSPSPRAAASISTSYGRSPTRRGSRAWSR